MDAHPLLVSTACEQYRDDAMDDALSHLRAELAGRYEVEQERRAGQAAQAPRAARVPGAHHGRWLPAPRLRHQPVLAGAGPGAARTYLRRALYGLRAALSEDLIINRGEDEIRLDHSVVWCDAVALQKRVRDGQWPDAQLPRPLD